MLTDDGSGLPSGRSAATSTALARANTPGLGSGVARPPGANRSAANWRWVKRATRRSRCASTMAPMAAVISSALVTSNAHR